MPHKRKTPVRVRSTLRALAKAEATITEETKLRRVQARVEVAAARVKERELRIQERQLQAQERAIDRRESNQAKVDAKAAVRELAQTMTHNPGEPGAGSLAPAPLSARSEQFEYEPMRYASDGTPLPRIVVSGSRTSHLVKVNPVATSQPATESEQLAAGPPWLQRGQSSPRDKAEWLAWQLRRQGH